MPTIVICAQNAMSRAGLASMVASSANQIVDKLETLAALSRWLQNGTVDLVLLDLSTMTATGFDELARMVETNPLEENVSFLLLVDSASLEDMLNRLLQRLLSSGWVSVLPTAVSANELKAAIVAITQGLVVIHPEVAESLFEADSQFFEPYPSLDLSLEAPIEPLTKRETEVLNQLASGLTNKAIAQNLHISEHTVKFHIGTLLSKLDANSRTEAVTTGIRLGLVLI